MNHSLFDGNTTTQGMSSDASEHKVVHDAYDSVVEMLRESKVDPEYASFHQARIETFENCRHNRAVLFVPMFGITSVDTKKLQRLLEDKLDPHATCRLMMPDTSSTVPYMELALPLARFRPMDPALLLQQKGPPTVLDWLLSWRILFRLAGFVLLISIALYVHNELSRELSRASLNRLLRSLSPV